MSVKVMSSEDLAKIVLNGERLFIFDVRNKDEFDNWKVEGRGIQVINEPYFNLLDGVEEVVDRLPKDQPILVICAKGGSSEFIGSMLVEAGFEEVYNLEGGMKAWSEYLEPVKLADLGQDSELYQFIRLGKGCLSYFIKSGQEAAVIDASRTFEVYKRFAEQKNTAIKYVMDTHLHADHISGGRALAEATGATYYLPPKDAEEVTFHYKPLEEGYDLIVGNTKITVQPIYSPGHTIGSTSFVIDERYLLTGDSLFVESIGRPDLAGKAEDWVSDLRNTLYKRYKDLSKELIVLPAHFANITELDREGAVRAKLGELYKKNTGLNVEDEAAFRKLVTENLPPQPNAYQEIRQMNMGQITASDEDQREMEMGPNRCAVS
ncbi:MAG TPA: MBL fold metallo-hydrolase [Sporolactobacillaceae bacterium]|nr:MBL fold metallo-hydrolase [Sporolactobacillaceae bacterium]